MPISGSGRVSKPVYLSPRFLTPVPGACRRSSMTTFGLTSSLEHARRALSRRCRQRLHRSLRQVRIPRCHGGGRAVGRASEQGQAALRGVSGTALRPRGYRSASPAPVQRLTRMRPPFVKGHTIPRNGIFAFFPLFGARRSRQSVSCSDVISVHRCQPTWLHHTRIEVPSPSG